MRGVPCPTACAMCARPGHYRLEGQCRTCPATDGTAMIIIMSLVVVCAAPILFKVSEQAKNFPALNIGISFSQSLAGGSLRTYTRLTLNRRTESGPFVRARVNAHTMASLCWSATTNRVHASV